MGESVRSFVLIIDVLRISDFIFLTNYLSDIKINDLSQ